MDMRPECCEPGGVARVLGFFTGWAVRDRGMAVPILSIDGSSRCHDFSFHRVPVREKFQATAMAIAELSVAEDRDLLS